MKSTLVPSCACKIKKNKNKRVHCAGGMILLFQQNWTLVHVYTPDFLLSSSRFLNLLFHVEMMSTSYQCANVTASLYVKTVRSA